jgi:hypothetical protein
MASMAGPELVDQMLANARSVASDLRVRSVLNPVLWLCAIVTLPCAVMAYLFRDLPVLSDLLMVLAALPVFVAVAGYVYFAIRDPKRLQSEEYQLREQTLDLIKSKGADVALLPSSLEAIANPAIRAIGSGGDA